MAVGLSTRSYAGSKPARCSSRSSSRASSSESSAINTRSEEHTSELQSQSNLVCRLLLEKKKNHRTRRLCYEKALERLYGRYPEGRAAAVFYALLVHATALPHDQPYANQQNGG